MRDTDHVFDPRGRVEAERVAALDGLRLGILDNTKWNANGLLRKTAPLLGERHRFAAVNFLFLITRHAKYRPVAGGLIVN